MSIQRIQISFDSTPERDKSKRLYKRFNGLDATQGTLMGGQLYVMFQRENFMEEYPKHKEEAREYLDQYGIDCTTWIESVLVYTNFHFYLWRQWRKVRLFPIRVKRLISKIRMTSIYAYWMHPRCFYKSYSEHKYGWSLWIGLYFFEVRIGRNLDPNQLA